MIPVSKVQTQEPVYTLPERSNDYFCYTYRAQGGSNEVRRLLPLRREVSPGVQPARPMRSSCVRQEKSRNKGDKKEEERAFRSNKERKESGERNGRADLILEASL